jgi:Uma2 family endonuclease
MDYIDAIEHLPTGGTLTLQQVGWEDYERLLTELGDGYSVRVSYDQGRLKIMSPLAEHEEYGDLIQDMARVLTRELGLRLETRGSATLKRELHAKGAEPDGCFYIQNAARIIGKRRIDLNSDPPPDIVVEIDLTHESLDKFPIYAALGVPEIWRYDGRQAHFYHLAGQEYIESPTSRAFPFLTASALAEFLEQSKTLGQDAALDSFRDWVHKHRPGTA